MNPSGTRLLGTKDIKLLASTTRHSLSDSRVYDLYDYGNYHNLLYLSRAFMLVLPSD